MANKRVKKPASDEEKFEQQLQEEQDLARLQRQYTLMEKDRKAFYEASGTKLAKQNKVLNIFIKEQRELITDLIVATTGSKRQEDVKVSNNLIALLKEYDDFNAKIKTKKAHLREIDYQIKEYKKLVHELDTKRITDYQYQARVLAGQKTLEALENKLEVQIKKFCAICADNRKLRAEIDHLLKERTDFNKLWDKLIVNLNIGKKFMLDLIEQATIAYDQREEWCSKLQALRIRAQNDQQHHTLEMRELQRKQDNDKKLEEFFSVKGQKRVMKDLEEKERLKRNEQKRLTAETLANYLEMVQTIMDFTEENDVGIIAKKFLKREAENFSWIRYVFELNREMEALNEEVTQSHLEIDELKMKHHGWYSKQGNTIGHLTEELATTTEEANDVENELHEAENKLNTMMKGIMQLFKLCRCKDDPLMKLLGDNTNINYYNVDIFIQLLEKKAQQLMLNVYHKEKQMLDKKYMKPEMMAICPVKYKPSIYLIENIVKTNPCPLCVEHEQVSDVIESLQTILDRPTAQVKLNQLLELPDGLERIHNVSACHLPKSRQIIQKRYQ